MLLYKYYRQTLGWNSFKKSDRDWQFPIRFLNGTTKIVLTKFMFMGLLTLKSNFKYA